MEGVPSGPIAGIKLWLRGNTFRGDLQAGVSGPLCLNWIARAYTRGPFSPCLGVHWADILLHGRCLFLL